MLKKTIKQAAQILSNADALLITAGAGMGVDSGLPDFRGNKGFWKAYPPIAKLGISFSQMANPSWFHRKPKLAWAFYGHRLNLYRDATPHSGFLQLLEIAKRKKGGYFVFTSNVDGHFQKAGFDKDNIIECHGSIHYLQCSTPCRDDIWDAHQIDVDMQAFEALAPHCQACGAIARPNILMFGDGTWLHSRNEKQTEKYHHWLQKLQENDLAIVEIGAGQAVPTVRIESEIIAEKYKGTLIRINPRESQVPEDGQLSIPLGAAEAVNRVFELLN
ncbi:NAD-dependent deacetylase [Candidatus Thiomargarita nelsonii]|uniref:protein acetyllysine N-acetyltransferase n=1 Tax=Candidatus Thiomargarita nelsonii TaxID=1003181 RepID=A0A0A6P236_9GAMM|nr:NAD-dependent deacetylase [Candidatus Thiomargarita nelsonii]